MYYGELGISVAERTKQREEEIFELYGQLLGFIRFCLFSVRVNVLALRGILQYLVVNGLQHF
jgi:hypothetical protein